MQYKYTVTIDNPSEPSAEAIQRAVANECGYENVHVEFVGAQNEAAADAAQEASQQSAEQAGGVNIT